MSIVCRNDTCHCCSGKKQQKYCPRKDENLTAERIESATVQSEDSKWMNIPISQR